MSAEISQWLLEDIDESQLESGSPITPLATDDAYVVYGNAYGDYYDYSVYYNYYNYSVYYNYYNYYNYSDSISVTRHPIAQSVLVNELVTFSVGASNTIDSCQWYVADDATSAGTIIEGATSPTFTFLATRDLSGNYYYCVVRRGGNSSTSNRASLTVMSLSATDIYVNIGKSYRTRFFQISPTGTEIVSAVVTDGSIATITPEGIVSGVSLGTTSCTVTGSNGAVAVFNIIVLDDSPVSIQVAILSNIATAIRAYRGVSYSIYPNQMANILRGSTASKPYNDLEELFTDIASAVREIDGSTELIELEDYYYRILSLID